MVTKIRFLNKFEVPRKSRFLSLFLLKSAFVGVVRPLEVANSVFLSKFEVQRLDQFYKGHETLPLLGACLHMRFFLIKVCKICANFILLFNARKRLEAFLQDYTKSFDRL